MRPAFGPRALIVRRGLIVGPFDPSGRLTHWVLRLARGVDVLTPDGRGDPVQFINARDLALWMLQLLGRDVAGTFNACGPAESTNLGEVHPQALRSTRREGDVHLGRRELPGPVRTGTVDRNAAVGGSGRARPQRDQQCARAGGGFVAAAVGGHRTRSGALGRC